MVAGEGRILLARAWWPLAAVPDATPPDDRACGWRRWRDAGLALLAAGYGAALLAHDRAGRELGARRPIGPGDRRTKAVLVLLHDHAAGGANRGRIGFDPKAGGQGVIQPRRPLQNQFDHSYPDRSALRAASESGASGALQRWRDPGEVNGARPRRADAVVESSLMRARGAARRAQVTPPPIPARPDHVVARARAADHFPSIATRAPPEREIAWVLPFGSSAKKRWAFAGCRFGIAHQRHSRLLCPVRSPSKQRIGRPPSPDQQAGFSVSAVPSGATASRQTRGDHARRMSI